MKKYDVAVIGGGLSGLIAAIDLAKAGQSVVLVEKSSRIGGRAMTVEKNGAASALPAISVREWVEQEIRDPKTRAFALANFRATSYTQESAASARRAVRALLEQSISTAMSL